MFIFLIKLHSLILMIREGGSRRFEERFKFYFSDSEQTTAGKLDIFFEKKVS